MYEDIKEQFRNVIQWSQRIPDPQVDSLFDKWEKSKERFIKAFGGLVYEHPEPIEFTLNEETQESRAMQFADFIYDSFDNEELAEFLDKNLKGFFENKVVNSCDTGIPEGMKLIKAFKFFENDKDRLQAMQNAASQLVQENKIKGTLCFSVHPLDFLSSSENTYNWRSCHALDGEYRAGNLSYMVDEVTFMVYLKGADNVILPAFGDEVPWNSKKWRMLMHFSTNNDIVFAGRQYPFSSNCGLEASIRIFKDLEDRMNPNEYRAFCDWENTYLNEFYDKDSNQTFYTTVKYLYVSHKLFDIYDIIKEGKNALNYNDLLHSTSYTKPYFAYRPTSKLKSLKKHPLEIGGEVKCLHCGKNIITNPATMRCDDCEFKYGYEENEELGSCACCGSRMWLEDGIMVEPYGDIVCEDCFKSECFVCSCCNNVFYDSNKHYLREDCWVCEDCYIEYKR